MSEGEDQGSIECPKCGATIKKVIHVGDSPANSCPACGKWLKKDDVPSDFPVEEREPKSKEEPEELEELEEESESPGILRQPKEAHEILNDVLKENDIDKDARKKLVRKCKRMPKPMHPGYLQTLLTKIKGGVKQVADAQLIADDYKWALEEAEEDYSDLLSRDRRRMRTEPRKTVGQERMSRIDRMEEKLEKLRQEKFESEKERIKEINRMEKKLLRSQIDGLRDQMRDMQNRFERQLDRLESNRQSGGDSYQSDEFRILGEGLDRLARVIEQKDVARQGFLKPIRKA